MKRLKEFIQVIFFFIIFLAPVYFQLVNNSIGFSTLKEDLAMDQNDEKDKLISSDIAGSDLYAEQINAYVAGNKSIIKQSLFTNDTNIFSQLDLNDPAFYKCNALISASNTINPGIFPKLLIESKIGSQYELGFNSFIGFFSYEEELSASDAQMRAERALEIIKRKFEIDLIMVNGSRPNCFIFVGDTPKWDLFFDEITNNLPMDGYWKALDLLRLTNEDYYNNYHLSSTFMIINSLSFIEEEPDFSTEQLNFNFQTLDLSFLENLEVEALLDQFNIIIENFGDLLNATISEEELEQFIEILGSFSLSNESSYTSLMIQYEGLSDGIKKVGNNQYMFNLWDSLGYQGKSLAPSEKIYIALIGAFMSDIEINLLCTDIIDQTPSNFEFYDYLLEQISLLLYLAGLEFDIQTLKDYSFELFWVNEEGFKKSYVKLVNPNDPSDIVNILQQLGFGGLSYIPTGIINPPEDFIFTYNCSNSEPNIILKKELLGNNASYGAYRNFTYSITAENIGNTTVWGVPTPIPLELNDFFLLLTLGNQPLADEFQNTIWDVVRIEYPNQYSSLEDFFNFDKDPLIFFFDSFGVGIYDTFFPDILNFTNLWPYNSDMGTVIDIMLTGYPQLITALAVLGVTPDELKDTFINNYSVWNYENWKLEPGEILSYEVENVSVANLDSFGPFYSNNFTINNSPQSPEVISGTSIDNTSPEMALTLNNESWVIESEEIFLKQRVEIDFIFKNDTAIDLVNNKLERISIIINFSTKDNLESLNFEIFNFSNEEFLNMTPYLDTIDNNTWTFSFINNNESLNWLFYPLDPVNYSVLFKIDGVDTEIFNISIDDLDIEFSTRDINVNEDTGSRVIFGSPTGNVQFERYSNSIPLSTYDMASIIATTHCTNYSSRPGALNTYIIDLKNIGSNTAENISIDLSIPGIINDINDFSLENSNLTYFLPNLNPSEVKTINFSFYTPNTRLISEVLITYDNPEKIQASNSSQLRSITNEVYLTSPIDYLAEFPFLRIINFSYNSSWNDVPTIGSEFNLSFNFKNTGPTGFRIPDLNISICDQIGDLIRVDNNSLVFEDIDFNETISFNITLKKIDWKGYFYPPINYIESSEGITIQILNSPSKILGEISFSLIKSVNKDQIEIGDEVIVFIDVKNMGTIAVNDIIVNDMISYSQPYFSLTEGKLIGFITSLSPGETFTFNYTIRAKRQSLVTLNPASITFYYLQKAEEQSNVLKIKINTPQLTQFSYIILPTLAVLFILALYFWQINKFKKKKRELKRTEMHIFSMSSRDSILKSELTLRDRLNALSKGLKKMGGNKGN
ncbi:MAG: hypothetical protein ACXAC5_05745 [Promethearchaeota archaeon]|jgi:uncharacterized repeat protein (TIGR01451 family)